MREMNIRLRLRHQRTIKRQGIERRARSEIIVQKIQEIDSSGAGGRRRGARGV